MAKSLASLKKRVRSIETTKKITNTMKLVSMSKYQHYSKQLKDIEAIYNGLIQLGDVNFDAKKKTLALCIVPDLGLISIYTKQVIQKLHDENIKDVIWIGSQGFESISNDGSFTILNPFKHSETLSVDEITHLIDEVSSDYNLVYVKATITNHSSLAMSIEPLSYTLSFDENRDYEPNYETVNRAYLSRLTYFVSLFTKINNKVMEHKLRQINMDKASDSAQDMLDHLNHEYHKLRQEKITQEINEIVSGRM